MKRRRVSLIFRRWMVALGMLAALPVGAQERPSSGGGGISGTVLDSGRSTPLQGAQVSLEAEGTAAVPGEGGAPFLGTGRATTSDAEGRYRFEGLAPGRYRLRISRIGYRPASVGVELRGAGDSRVSVGLTMEPVALEPVEVRGVAPDPFGRDAQVESEVRGARVRSARARQREFLPSDVRELTNADVLESVTLGETDLFRALQRAPGVAARDDYGADFWVRGASWDQTRVYFDGIPLFNPVHGFGLLSAVNTDAIGGALLHPGVRSAALGDAAAGVVDVSSRPAGGAGELRGLGDLSLTSARAALDQRFLDGRAGWMVAGRRSWVDLAGAAAARLADDPEYRLPYSFADLTGRFDLALAGGRALEASGLWETDAVRGTIPDVLHRTRAEWGNAAGRVSYSAPFAGYRSRHTLGISRYVATVRETEPDTVAEGGFSAHGERDSDNALTHLSLSGELAPDLPEGRVLPWRAGYSIVHQSGAYEGPEGYAYNRYQPSDADSLILVRGALTQAALWGERRWTPADRLTVEAGLRMEVGEKLENAGPMRVSPRLSARFAPTPELALSAGVGRSFQYAQALAPTGPSLNTAGIYASHPWLVADRGAPAIRSDVATLGGELWMSGDWLLAANAYLRHSTGVALPDPTPGVLVNRPLFITGENTARGVELSARRLAGRWTASGSYTLAFSEMSAARLDFPAEEDRRHSVDLTSMLRVGSSLRLGGAFTYTSGAPYTQVWAPYWSCSRMPAPCDQRLRTEAPNAQRTPSYSSLDLLLDWTRRLRGWDFGAYLQLRNALGHDNAVAVTSTTDICEDRGYTAICPTRYVLVDEFRQGLPTLPVIGFRVRF